MNKKTLPILLILGVLLVPSVTYASWWNPFTWNIFKKKNQPVVEMVQNAPTSLSVPNTSVNIESIGKKKELKETVITNTPTKSIDVAPLKNEIAIKKSVLVDENSCIERIAFFENDVKNLHKEVKSQIAKLETSTNSPFRLLSSLEKELATNDADLEMKTMYVEAKIAPDSVCSELRGVPASVCAGREGKWMNEAKAWIINYKLKSRPELVSKITRMKADKQNEIDSMISTTNNKLQSSFSKSELGQCKEYNYDYR